MSTIAFVCLAVVCVALGIINMIFNKLVGWQGIVVRGLSILSLIAFNLIVSNLRGINNALPLFITLALACILLAEAICVSMSDKEKLKPVINSVFFAFSCVLFSLSGVSLSEFSLLAFLGGLSAGIGIGLIICAIKKEKALNQILMNILSFACIGILIGFGVNAVIASKHIISSVCLLVGGALMLMYRALTICGHGKTAGYLASAFKSLALIALTLSIYFY